MIGSERPGVTYSAVNVEGTRSIARIAVESPARRALVMFSGLGVARYGQAPRTTNRYFLSKLEAEIEVYRSGVPAVVFRPSLHHGPGRRAGRRRCCSGPGAGRGRGAGRRPLPHAAGRGRGRGGGRARRPRSDPPQPVGPLGAIASSTWSGPSPSRTADFVERFADVARALGHVGRLRGAPHPGRGGRPPGRRGRVPRHACRTSSTASCATRWRTRRRCRTLLGRPAAAARRRDRARLWTTLRIRSRLRSEPCASASRSTSTARTSCPGHPKCGQVHGHTYRVDVTIEGDHNQGMVVDFNDLKAAARARCSPATTTGTGTTCWSSPRSRTSASCSSRELRARISFPMVVRVWEGNGKWAEM